MHIVSIWDFALMTLGPLVVLVSAYIQSEVKPKNIGKAARNERRKITASYFNGIALALFVASSVSLFFSADLFATISPSYEMFNRTVATVFGLSMSLFFHFAARLLLIRLED